MRKETQQAKGAARKSEIRKPQSAIGSFGAILFGTLLIVVLTPLTQFLTLKTLNTDLETATPVGWAVGLIMSIVLIVVTVRMISRLRIVSKSTMVILYTMLTIAVPMMNIGLGRPVICALTAVQKHYAGYGVNTYRTSYESEKATWFPVVPSVEGLAWNKADNLLRTLQAPGLQGKRDAAKRNAVLAISLEAKRRAGSQQPAAADPALTQSILANIALLGPNEAAQVAKQCEQSGDAANPFREAAAAMKVLDAVEQRATTTRAESAAATERLISTLAAFDEHEANYLPQIMKERRRSDRGRFMKDLGRLSADGRQALDRKIELMAPRLEELRSDVSLLNLSDFAKVRGRRAEQLQAEFRSLSHKQIAGIRGGFLCRASRGQRTAMYGQSGLQDAPNQNLAAIRNGLLGDAGISKRLTPDLEPVPAFREKLSLLLTHLPWGLWRGPLLRWGMLFLSIFLFLMCIAEWLRRKWVDRENLAFPLVEIADNIIRHDYELESAEDILDAQPRKRPFNGLFWAGFALGALFITVEALGQYNITSSAKFVNYNVTTNVFTSGIMKEMKEVFFVLSPIVVGLLFLVSLEVSFSIWALYFIYKLVFVFVRQSIELKIGGEIRDPIYTGWGGGVRWPFEGEQLLGACLCLTGIILYKAWRSAVREKHLHHHHGPEATGNAFITPKLNVAGLVGLPIVIGLMVWDLGVTNIPFMIFVGLTFLGLVIAVARVRAESGLPAQHVTYEFAKLPLVFGMTGWLGARVYTLFISLAFIPVTLLARVLPQHLENIELARRNRVKYGTIAWASLAAFITATAAGLLGVLVFTYYKGSAALGAGHTQVGGETENIFSYPMWVSHFLGEAGLETFTTMHGIRICFLFVGAAILGLLVFLRQRIMKFRLHYLGYLLILLATHFVWITPYVKSPDPSAKGARETGWLWGSAMIAWLVKKLVIKYGGMNTYKRLKPLFIGMVVGSVFCIFAWCSCDLIVSIQRDFLPAGADPTDFMKFFIDKSTFNPRAY